MTMTEDTLGSTVLRSTIVGSTTVLTDASKNLEVLKSKNLLSQLTKKELDQLKQIKPEIRRYEFVQSRLLLRKQLKKFVNISEMSFHRNDYGYIDFPHPWLGSLSHKEGVIAIGVQEKAHQSTSRKNTLGIDIECAAKSYHALLKKCLTQNGRELFLKKSLESKYLYAIFSAKESIFKSHFPVHKKMFYFQDAEIIDLDLEKSQMRFCILKELFAGSLDHIVTAHFKWLTFGKQEYVLTVVEDDLPI